eukprot:11172316-Lingulodinium_polyedra.AAC.1
MYLRPGEVAMVKRTPIVRPTSGSYPHWGIVVAPSGSGGGPRKSGAFDDTVFAGDANKARRW